MDRRPSKRLERGWESRKEGKRERERDKLIERERASRGRESRRKSVNCSSVNWERGQAGGAHGGTEISKLSQFSLPALSLDIFLKFIILYCI